MKNECAENLYFFNDCIKQTNDFPNGILDFGVSVYDVFNVKNKVPIFFEKYYNRIENTLKKVDCSDFYIQNIGNVSNSKYIKLLINKLTDINNCNNGAVKIVFSFNNNFDGNPKNYFLLYFLNVVLPTDNEYITGINTMTMEAERDNPQVKIFNSNLRKKADKFIADNNITEALLLNNKGFITEGSRSNFFAIKDNIVFTPKHDFVLPGIVGQNIREICKNFNLNIIEKDIKIDELHNYQAAFISDTPRGICPIKKINDINYDANNKIVRTIINNYNSMCNDYITNYKLED
ncbi:MAG: aminotransferase class IV [Bacteroidales bacterium]|nr:aminotransferase class IV [Bacteroidales bacterium]